MSYISDKVERLSGLNDFENDSLVQNLAACRKFYDDQKHNKTVTHLFSRFGDIAQIDETTYVDCNRNLIGLQQFHTMHPTRRDKERIMALHR